MEIDTGKGQTGIASDRLMEHNQFLRERINQLNGANTSMRAELKRVCDLADKHWKSFIDTHNALNVLREDAQRVLTEAGAWEMRLELDGLREDFARYKTRARESRKVYQELARRAAKAKAAESQKARDLEVALEQMRRKAEQFAAERDGTAKTAEEAVAKLDAKLDRIAEQCNLWHRGELDTMTTIAGITGEMNGHSLPEPGAWERAKAVRAAEIISLLNEATDKISAIEVELEEAGVGFTGDHLQQVKDMIQVAESWKQAHADQRELVMLLARKLGADNYLYEALENGDYDGATALLKELDAR